MKNNCEELLDLKIENSHLDFINTVLIAALLASGVLNVVFILALTTT